MGGGYWSPEGVVIAADDGYVMKGGKPLYLKLSEEFRQPVCVRLVGVWYLDGVTFGNGFAFFDDTMKLSDEMRKKISYTVTDWIIDEVGDRHIEEAHFCHFFGKDGYKFITDGEKKYPFKDLEKYLRNRDITKIRYGKTKGPLVNEAHKLVSNCRQNIQTFIWDKSRQYTGSSVLDNVDDFEKSENNSIGDPPTKIILTDALKGDLEKIKETYKKLLA